MAIWDCVLFAAIPAGNSDSDFSETELKPVDPSLEPDDVPVVKSVSEEEKSESEPTKGFVLTPLGSVSFGLSGIAA